MPNKTLTNDIKCAITSAKRKLILAYAAEIISSEKHLLSLNRKMYRLKNSIYTIKKQKKSLKAAATARNKIQLDGIEKKIAHKKSELTAIRVNIKAAKEALTIANQAYNKVCFLQKAESTSTHPLSLIQKPNKKQALLLTPNLALPVLPSIRPHNKPQSIWKPLLEKNNKRYNEYR